MRQGLVQLKFNKDKKCFTSGIRTYQINRKRRRPGGLSMAEYFSGDRYKIRVVIVHFFQNQMQNTSVQTSPTPTERGNLQRRRPGIAEIDKDEVVSPNYRINFEKVIRGFHQPLGLKNNIFIKVLRENFFQSSIPHAFVHIIQL